MRPVSNAPRAAHPAAMSSPSSSPGTPANAPAAPGDEVPPGSPSSGENVCPACGGSGRVDSGECPNCGGTGKVNTGVGGG
jgi:hypothetical protein